MKLGTLGRVVAGIALASPTSRRRQAQSNFEAAFDSALGTQVARRAISRRDYSNPLVAQIAQIADGSNGRIGVAAIDLSTGEEVAILGDQPFPMASTSKIAIAATYLEGVDRGRWSLTSEFPLMIPVASRRSRRRWRRSPGRTT
jgi:beta-lactamase class A